MYIVTSEKPYQQARQFFIKILIIAMMVGVLLFFYRTFFLKEHHEFVDMQVENVALKKTVNELKKQNQLITADISVHTQTEEIIQKENKKLQEQIYLLKKDISLYQKIMSSNPKKAGIKIAKIELKPTAIDGHYQFQIILTQENAEHQLAQGMVTGRILGKNLEGKASSVSLNQAVSQVELLKYKFRYFQVLEGEMVLPERFKPDALQFELSAAGECQRQVMQSFHWIVKEAIYHVEEQSREKHQLS